MRDFKNWIAGIAIWGLAGCASGEFLHFYETTFSDREVTLIVDTQPSGAGIYYTVRGGAKEKCENTTPVRINLELELEEKTWKKRKKEDPIRHRESRVRLKSVNGRPIDQFEKPFRGLSVQDRQLNCGFRYIAGRNGCIDFPNTEFRKTGFVPLETDYKVVLGGLFNNVGNEYKVTLPLKAAPTKVATTQVEEPKIDSTGKLPFEAQEGFTFNVRAVAIPSGMVVGTAAGVASSKKNIPVLLSRLCNKLEIGWEANEKPRVSIVGIVEIDKAAKEKEVGRFATECLYTAFGNQKNLLLMERSQVEEFLKEHNLTIEEVIDNPQSLGKMTGIDFVVLGSVAWVGE